MSTTNVNNYKQKKNCDIFGQLYTEEYKATKNQILSQSKASQN